LSIDILVQLRSARLVALDENSTRRLTRDRFA
jgi:hypothetical protein